jgi:hypothetical protein
VLPRLAGIAGKTNQAGGASNTRRLIVQYLLVLKIVAEI